MGGAATRIESFTGQHGMRRFYHPLPLTAHSTISLPSTIQHHWVTVLRASVGDQAVLFDGRGGEHVAELVQIDKKISPS